MYPSFAVGNFQHPFCVFQVIGGLHENATRDTHFFSLPQQLFNIVVAVQYGSIIFQPRIFCLTKIPDMNMCIDQIVHDVIQTLLTPISPNCSSISSLCSPSKGAPLSETNNFPSMRMGHLVVVTESPLLVFTFISMFSTLYPFSFTSLS